MALSTVRCKEGKDCPSKCKDKEIIFNLGDQASNQCAHFELSSLVTEGRKRYKLDRDQWICSNNHVVSGVEEGKQAHPCPECEETFEARLNAYVTSRLASLALDVTNGVHRMFYKSGGVPNSTSFNQFIRCIFGSHGQAGTGIRRLAGVSARQPCTNWCSRPVVDLNEVLPKFSGDKEIYVTKIVPLLEALSQSQNPLTTFNPAVLSRSFSLVNLLTYLWCDLAMLVGSIQESWERYHHLVPLKIWNCKGPVIYGKM